MESGDKQIYVLDNVNYTFNTPGKNSPNLHFSVILLPFSAVPRSRKSITYYFQCNKPTDKLINNDVHLKRTLMGLLLKCIIFKSYNGNYSLYCIKRLFFSLQMTSHSLYKSPTHIL